MELAQKLYEKYTESTWFVKPWDELNWEEKELWEEMEDVAIENLKAKAPDGLIKLVAEANYVFENIKDERMFEPILMAQLMILYPNVFK